MKRTIIVEEGEAVDINVYGKLNITLCRYGTNECMGKVNIEILDTTMYNVSAQINVESIKPFKLEYADLPGDTNQNIYISDPKREKL